MSKVVTEDGWYRVSIRAGMEEGSRRRPVMMRLDYAPGTEAQVTAEFDVIAPKGLPQRRSRALFLRRSEVAELVPYWNPHRGLMRPTSAHKRVTERVVEAERRLRRWLDKQADEKVLRRYREALAAARAEAVRHEGPAFEYHPTMDRETPPRLRLDYIRVEGPLSSETLASQANEPVTFRGRFEAE